MVSVIRKIFLSVKITWAKMGIVFAQVIFGLLSACTPQNDCGCVAPPETGVSFFYPMIGQSVIYDVEEIQYTLTGINTAKTYQFKETANSFFTDSDGKEAIKIDRYRRENEAQKWVIDSVYKAKREIDKALKTENNQTFVKMIFPMKEGLKWDGNLYNSLGNDTYEMKKVNKAFQTNGQNFPNTLSVIQQNDSTLVDLKRRVEVYAEGIGLIYQEKTFLSYCNNGDCLGKGKIDFGTKYVLKFKRKE
jgi:hypothetical protein